MIPRWLPLALFAIVFAPGFLHAQQPSNPYSDQRIPIVQAPANYDKMYEDLEVLRRILDQKLHSHFVRHQYPSWGNTNLNSYWFTPQGTTYQNVTPYILPQTHNPGVIWSSNTGQELLYQLNLTDPNKLLAYTWQAPITWEESVFPTLEGVYLKGQGVVYTATLSSLQSRAKTEPASKPISEWERVRRQVRNEKEEPKKPEATKPPSLSDVLLKVLAENGHHFSQLGENESLTIILTVHEPDPPASAPKSAEKGSTKTESKTSDSGGSDLRSRMRDLELLGELHMKQAKCTEAITVFQRALELTPNPKQQAELLRKLAQCYLLQGQDEKARNELDKAILILKKGTEMKEKPAVVKPSASVLPAKLIISAPKKLLVEAKEGKLPFEEFRRRAHVEMLRFNDRR